MPADYPPDLTGIGRGRKLPIRLDAATTTAARPTSAIMGNGSHVLDSSDPETLTRQHPNRGLRAWTGGPGLVAARSPDTNMERSDPLILSHFRGGRGSLHSSIRGPLKTVSLNMLTTSASGNSLSTGQIGNVHHRIIEAGVDVRDSPMVDLLGLVYLLRHNTTLLRNSSRYRRI